MLHSSSFVYRPLLYLSSSLKSNPLALGRRLLKGLPTVLVVSDVLYFSPNPANLHLGLNHGIRQLELALSDLDDLLNQAGTNLVLQLSNPARTLARSSPTTPPRKPTAQ